MEVIDLAEKAKSCRKNVFAKVSFYCLLVTCLTNGVYLFLSGIIYYPLPESLYMLGWFTGIVGFITLFISLVRLERWSFYKICSLVIISVILLLIGVAIYINLYHSGTPRIFHRYR